MLPAYLQLSTVLSSLLENAGLTAVDLGHALQLVKEMVADLQDQKHAEGGSSRPGHVHQCTYCWLIKPAKHNKLSIASAVTSREELQMATC